MSAEQQAVVVDLLRARNRASAAACRATRGAESVQAACAALEARSAAQQQQLQQQQHAIAEQAADLKLLQNEGNAGVSRTHIEVLQDQLDRAKSENVRLAAEGAENAASASAANEVATDVGARLAEASAQAADAQHALKQTSASEAKLRAENEQLIERLAGAMDSLRAAMDSEEQQVTQRRLSREASELAASASAAEPAARGAAEAPPMSPPPPGAAASVATAARLAVTAGSAVAGSVVTAGSAVAGSVVAAAKAAAGAGAGAAPVQSTAPAP